MAGSTDNPLPSRARSARARITYLGAWLDKKTMAEAASWMTDVSGVKPALGPVPDGVEVYPRYGAKGAVYILVNFSKTPQTVKLPATMQDVLSGGSTQSVTLPHYGVAVLASAK